MATYILAILAGGALGALMRFSAGNWLLPLMGSSLPFGTLFVNVSGAFLVGFLFVWFTGHLEAKTSLRHFLVVGFLGSFTTFSAFSLEVVQMLQADRWKAALLYMFVSVFLCLLMTILGIVIARKVF